MKLQITLTFLFATTLLSQTPDPQKILKRIDDNLRPANRISESKMIINGRRSSRTIVAKSWIRGTDESFSKYLAPAREKGTKMLKLGDQLWTYSPSTDRTIKISGHMLRQSVMGSDLSYEDMMEDPYLQNMYKAEIIGEEEKSGRPCWVLQLTAARKVVAYHSRKMWVDKERYLPLREERYAKSGKLLKTTEMKEMQQINGRWFFKHLLFKDMLKNGDGTELIIGKVQMDVKIPDYIFSKASLRK